MSLFILTVDLDVLELELGALDRDTRVPMVLLDRSRCPGTALYRWMKVARKAFLYLADMTL